MILRASVGVGDVDGMKALTAGLRDVHFHCAGDVSYSCVGEYAFK